MAIQRENLCDDEQTGNRGLDVLRGRIPSRRSRTASFQCARAPKEGKFKRESTSAYSPREACIAVSRLPATLFTTGSMSTEIGNKLFIAQLPVRDFVINARGNEQPATAVMSAVF